MPARIELRLSASALAAGLISAAITAYYFWTLHLRHAHYDTYAYDLGLIAQVSWNTLQGRWFETTLLPFNYLAEHLAPSLVLLSPLFLLWPDARVLLVVQALAVGAASLGIYWAAKLRTGDPLAALFLQLAFGAAPATGWAGRDEFHAITLAMPALAFGTALLWRGRYGWAALVAGSALLANEDAAVVVAPLGLLIAVVALRPALAEAPDNRGQDSAVSAGSGSRLPAGAARGLGLAGLAALWLGVYLFAIAPIFRPSELLTQLPHPNLRAFSQCGSTLTDIARCLLDPSTLARLGTAGDHAALLTVLGPTLGLGLLGPSFLVTLPRWLILLLGNDPPLFQAHYVALLTTGAYLAAGEAAGWLRSRLGALVPRAAAGLILTSSLAGFLLGSPLPGGGAYRAPPSEQERRFALMDQAVGFVEGRPTATVAATSSLIPHLALRPVVTLPLDGQCPEPDFRIYDLRDIYGVHEGELRAQVAEMLKGTRYRALLNQDEVVAFARVPLVPDMPRDDLFGGSIRLRGVGAAADGDGVGVRLLWHKERPVARDYHFFVHLVDGSRRMYSQSDGQLRGGRLPLTAWNSACPVEDEVRLAAPPPDRWPAYHLEIGWYDLQTGERLRLPDGRDYVELPLVGLS